MICESCKAKIPTMATRLKRVNEGLHALGRIYWDTVGKVLHNIDGVLAANGFEQSTDVLLRRETANSLHVAVATNKWLHVTWYRLESGRYEVTAYVN
jgi:hypothetical protein